MSFAWEPIGTAGKPARLEIQPIDEAGMEAMPGQTIGGAPGELFEDFPRHVGRHLLDRGDVHDAHARRVERLKREGLSDNEIGRIHAPIGLDIDAVSPAEIAVAIMGEITQVLRQKAETT